MIKIKIQGGLGNQMFQYAYGRSLSIKENQELTLDIKTYSNVQNRSFILDQYNIKARVDSSQDDSSIIEGYWQSEKYFKDITELIQQELTPKQNSNWRNGNFYQDINSSLSVSIHIRRTDYTTPKHRIIYDNLSIGYYVEAINRIKSTLHTDNIKLFIFSDDIQWVKDNIEKYLTNQFVYVSGNGLADVEEHFLMSQCKHNIIANSTYSWWGAWLNPNPDKIVISPAKWFVDGREEKDLIPKNWTKIINDPKISVIMPVYKNCDYLKVAIDSILGQTFENFEFIIIEDKSDSKQCGDIIKSYNDPRIKHIVNESRLGIAESLNLGIKISRGDYIARMDSDDIALPNRLEKQYEFMENNKDIAVSGTSCKTIGDKSHYRSKPLIYPDDIKAGLLFNSCLAHPTVIMRKTFLEQNNLHYKNQFIEEDYDLWVRISEYGKISNIRNLLLYYRMHESSLMKQNKADKRSTVNMIRGRQIEKLALKPNESELEIHNSIICEDINQIDYFIETHQQWLELLLKQNEIMKVYTPESLKKIIYTRWYNICSLNAKKSKSIPSIFRQSKIFSEYRNKSYVDIIKIFIKSLLKI